MLHLAPVFARKTLKKNARYMAPEERKERRGEETPLPAMKIFRRRRQKNNSALPELEARSPHHRPPVSPRARTMAQGGQSQERLLQGALRRRHLVFNHLDDDGLANSCCHAHGARDYGQYQNDTAGRP